MTFDWNSHSKLYLSPFKESKEKHFSGFFDGKREKKRNLDQKIRCEKIKFLFLKHLKRTILGLKYLIYSTLKLSH